jgi:outer membrane receptor protein involved in Fe transport
MDRPHRLERRKIAVIKSNRRFILACGLLVYLLTVGSALAGVTGKISGTVKDAETGDPLPGVNVVLEGTTLGAATGLDGSYYILNIPPGTYSVRATMIGYTPVVQKGVLVRIDLTTVVDFALSPTVLEAGEEVVVTAERPLIQRDITAKVSVIGGEEIQAMPVNDFRDMLRVQAGFTDALHLRGGRSNQVAYLIDGLDVTNPLFGNYAGTQADRSETLGQADNQLFAGAYVSDPNLSNYDGVVLDKEAVEEVQVLTGTFNAEYGRAMSGIVNVVTRDPAPKPAGQFEYLSPRLNESPYRKPNALAIDENPGPSDSLRYQVWRIQDKFTQWDRRNLIGQFRGSLSAAVPGLKKTTFLVTSRYRNDNGYLPFGYDMTREVLEKVVFRPSAAMKFSFIGNHTRKYWQPYNHDWKYLPDNYSRFRRFSDRFSLLYSHTLSPSTFYTIKVSRLTSRYDRKVAGLEVVVDRNDYPAYDPIRTDYERPERWENGFFYRGHDISIEDSRTRTWNIKMDLTSQVSKTHLLKTGFDVLEHRIERFVYKQPYLGGIHEFQDYVRRPLEMSAYLQDKMEYDFLIVNLGVRVDYFAPNGIFKGRNATSGPFYPYDNEEATAFRDIYVPGYVDENGDFQYFPEVKARAQWRVSPRIGVAHPVTERLSFHFAYGHFFQRPDFRDIFYTHDIQRTFQLAGNPNAKVQKTVAFEAGLKQAIGDIISLDVSVYYKNIYDLLGTQYVHFFPYIYSIINNSDYANVKGFEVSIQKRYSSYFSASLNYTLSIARGNENTSRTGVKLFYGSTNNRLRPRRDFYLAWDRRHTIGGNVNIWIPKGQGPSIGGVRPFENFGLNMLVSVRSGLPYTPTERARGEWDYWLRILQTNTARRPWTYQLDLDITKEMRLGAWRLTAFARIINLLDTQNVLWVYTNTGRVWDDGQTSARSDDFIRDPSAVGPPRQVMAGLRFRL